MKEMFKKYLCPITHSIMDEPVIAEDGYTYEKMAILSWLRNPINQNLSPITKQVLNISNLIINRNIKDLIESYKKLHTQPIAVNDNSTNIVKFSRVSEVTHIKLINNLAAALEVNIKEIYTKKIVEQTIVAMAGIYTCQKQSVICQDTITDHISFILNFASVEEYQKFLTYYKGRYPHSILDSKISIENKAKIIFGRDIFNNVIIPEMGEYKKNNHLKVLELLATKLNIPYEEIYTNSNIEQYLVDKASISTTQESAYFKQQRDYTIKFYLTFANSDEYRKFIDYYDQSYPNLIINKDVYEFGQLTGIGMDTKILLNLPGQSICKKNRAINKV